jgi:YegS/Rv2252/BmrU family lipid kinase
VPGSIIVVNPQASKARDATTLAALTERAITVLAERDGAEPRLVETASPGDVEPIVGEALEAGVASVVGVGGDGTLRQIAGVLAGTEVPLGVVPAGTGNQVAAALDVPRSPLEAVDALGTAVVRKIDLGEVTVDIAGRSTTSVCLIGCGAGFDAQLMATTPAGLKRRLGSVAYFVQAARMVLGLSATPCRVTVDEETFETGATIVLIGNMGHLVPGRLDLRLPLDPYDGLLELILVGASGLVSGLRGLTDQLRRTHLGGGAGDPSIRLRGRSITLEPAEPMPLEIDGDYVGQGSLSARVLPQALAVLLPSR